MKLKIFTDSSSDFTLDEAKKLGVEIIPIAITIGDKEYADGYDLTKEEFYDKLINGKVMPKTSQPAPQKFVDSFEKVKENNETALVLLISSGMSGAKNSALLAKEIVEYEDIHIVETKTTIAGLQLLVLDALKNFDKGLSIEEIIESIEVLREKIKVFACMDTLKYLVKGGRLKAIEGKIAELISIKPLITFTDGKVDIIGKPIGKIRANLALMKLVEENPIDFNYPVYYYYSYNKENLDVFISKLTSKNLYHEGKVINLSPVVGSHIGDCAYGLVYVKK